MAIDVCEFEVGAKAVARVAAKWRRRVFCVVLLLGVAGLGQSHPAGGAPTDDADADRRALDRARIELELGRPDLALIHLRSVGVSQIERSGADVGVLGVLGLGSSNRILTRAVSGEVVHVEWCTEGTPGVALTTGNCECVQVVKGASLDSVSVSTGGFSIRKLSWSGRLGRLAVVAPDGSLHVGKAEGGSSWQRLVALDGRAWVARWLHDGRLIVGAGGEAELVDPISPTVTRAWSQHDDPIEGFLEISPLRVLVREMSGGVFLLDLRSQTPTRTCLLRGDSRGLVSALRVGGAGGGPVWLARTDGVLGLADPLDTPPRGARVVLGPGPAVVGLVATMSGVLSLDDVGCLRHWSVRGELIAGRRVGSTQQAATCLESVVVGGVACVVIGWASGSLEVVRVDNLRSAGVIGIGKSSPLDMRAFGNDTLLAVFEDAVVRVDFSTANLAADLKETFRVR